MSHTPGTWVVSTLNGRTVVGPMIDGHPLQRAVATCINRGADETKANAALIAAAPDLLAALAALEYSGEPGRFCDHAAAPCDHCAAASAALARARGEIA